MIAVLQTTLKRKIQEIQVKAIIQSDFFNPLLEDCVETIREQAHQADNEATVESAFEISFYGLLREINIKIFPKKEKRIDTVRHISKGRMDSNIGALVIEFKHRSKLGTTRQMENASHQLKDYLVSLSSKDEAYFLGAVTDGIKIRFFTCQNSQVFEEQPHELRGEDIIRLMRSAIALNTKTLSAKNLVSEFCEPKTDNLAKNLIKILYRTIKKSPTQKTYMLNEEWERLFKLGHEDKSHQKKIEERGVALSRIVGEKTMPMSEQYKVLFCAQTAYATIVKLIAYRVISDIVFHSPLQSFKSLSTAESNSLRIFFSEFEEGSTFREIGIDNLLEGDFFSWYCTKEQWNEEIYMVLKEVISRLSDYEDKQDIFHKSTVNDLFRELYQHIMPSVVRYSLGEYYTPKWLAQHLLENASKNKVGWRGLDPCAGSGTFLIAMIEKVINENKNAPRDKIFNEVIHRVKGIDLNPLAVLTSRVNYFIAISPYLPKDIKYIEIPVHLGDSANIPRLVNIAGVECIQYKIDTKIDSMEITLPRSSLSDPKKFSETMFRLEACVSQKNKDKAKELICDLIASEERSTEIIRRIDIWLDSLIKLEINKWNRIWTRIVKNFLTTANLGKFDVIIGNPPWIDWKNLPTGYREKIKSLCIKKEMFSGDHLTGGINLNICALITNVVAENYLDDDGTFAFLMPKSIIFQQTYEGFRNLKIEYRGNMYFQEFHDWTKSGHPFHPVQQQFLTYYMSFKKPRRDYVPVRRYSKNRGESIRGKENNDLESVIGLFDIEDFVCGQVSASNTAFTYAKTREELTKFREISGICTYIGREGIEFYPQEIMILSPDAEKVRSGEGIIWVKNFQNEKSKYRVPQKSVRMEKKYLYPLLKGVDIKRFRIVDTNYLVPFPYESKNPRKALTIEELVSKSPLLLKYLESFKEIIEKQTEYNEKIKGKYGGIYYSLARVGKYTFAPHHVVFRDNTKWCAAVVSSTNNKWVGKKLYLTQNHAVSMCEDEKGNFIAEDEAHFICAILNCPIVERFILQSSDSRTFKIQPPIFIPKYNIKNVNHVKLRDISIKAHENPDNVEELREEAEKIYMSICSSGNPNIEDSNKQANLKHF